MIRTLRVLSAMIFITAGGRALGGAPASEIDKLGVTGTEFTPIGAIRAGTQDGQVPAWDGGIKIAPQGFEEGGWYIDPYAGDTPLMRITKDNFEQYSDLLTDGQRALFRTYPETYWMDVYPSHRSIGYLDSVYEATKRNAAEQKLCGDRCIVPNAYGGGFPFPILYGPDQELGQQILWNGYVSAWPGSVGSWRADNISGFLVNANGSYTRVSGEVGGISTWWVRPELLASASHEVLKPTELMGQNVWCVFVNNIEPPRQAGTAVTNCSFSKSIRQQIFLYIPGQRRVRRAPELGVYDAPGNNSDGLRTSDAFNGFVLGGAEERYDYLVHGRKVKFVPYNSYKAASPDVKESELVLKGHLDPRMARWEAHRVWEVELKLKPGFRHLSPHRFVYVDEDSWTPLLAHMYDTKEQMWRAQENIYVYGYDHKWPMLWSDSHYDLLNGRYFVSGSLGWMNVGRKPSPVKFSSNLDLINPDIFTPQGLRNYGIR